MLATNHDQTVLCAGNTWPNHNQTVVVRTPTVKPQHNQTLVRR